MHTGGLNLSNLLSLGFCLKKVFSDKSQYSGTVYWNFL